jgi:hypothetical protein
MVFPQPVGLQKGKETNSSSLSSLANHLRSLLVIAHSDEGAMPQMPGIRPFDECDTAAQLRVVGSNNITCLSVDAVGRIWAWAIHVDWHCPGADSCARLSRLLRRNGAVGRGMAPATGTSLRSFPHSSMIGCYQGGAVFVTHDERRQSDVRIVWVCS